MRGLWIGLAIAMAGVTSALPDQRISNQNGMKQTMTPQMVAVREDGLSADATTAAARNWERNSERSKLIHEAKGQKKKKKKRP